MKNFGKVILGMRKAHKMTRDGLAKGICSGKYIYMLERGERSPSVEMITKLGEVMKEDLFQYVPFADCDDPIGMKRIVDGMNHFKSSSEYLPLMALIQQAKEMDDFKRKPWSDELTYNEIFCEVYQEPWCQKTLEKVEGIITVNGGCIGMNVAKGCRLSDSLLKYYNLLAYYHFQKKDFEQASEYVGHTYERYKKLRHLKQYQEQFITVTLNHLRTLAHWKTYDVMVPKAEDLIGFMRHVKSFERMHAVHYYLSQAFYHKGHQREAVEEYVRFLHYGLSASKPEDYAVYVSSPFSLIMKKGGLLKTVILEVFG